MHPPTFAFWVHVSHFTSRGAGYPVWVSWALRTSELTAQTSKDPKGHLAHCWFFHQRHVTGLAQDLTPLETNVWQGPRCSLTESSVRFSSKGFREKDPHASETPLCQLLLGSGSPNHWRMGQVSKMLASDSSGSQALSWSPACDYQPMGQQPWPSQSRQRRKRKRRGFCLFLALESAPWSPRLLYPASVRIKPSLSPLGSPFDPSHAPHSFLSICEAPVHIWASHFSPPCSHLFIYLYGPVFLLDPCQVCIIATVSYNLGFSSP